MAKVIDYVLFDTTNFKGDIESELAETSAELANEYPEATIHHVQRGGSKLLFLIVADGYMTSSDLQKYVDSQIRELRLMISDNK